MTLVGLVLLGKKKVGCMVVEKNKKDIFGFFLFPELSDSYLALGNG